MTFEAFYLPAAFGQRFCVFHPPDARIENCGAVVFVHPFAEEMNKSRRMAALQAKAMAHAGFAVLQVDLLGCGDSSGDFGDASWDAWVGDTVLASEWLRRRYDTPLWLWGLRAGCLLACDAAARIEMPSRLLLWQPVVSGKQFLQQFLRLKVAGEMLGSDAKGVMEDLRDQLARGESVEIAGYRLSPAMASGLEQAELLPPASCHRIEWFELSAKTDGNLSPIGATRIAKWQSAGHDARSTVISGPAFWQTTEITECPPLIEATLQTMTKARQA
jgi:exosortase A-associated hydrolase 2